MSHASFFLAALIWNFGLGMSWLVVPLYAASQGLTNAQIGMLFAVPVFAQIGLNLMGGAYTDRIGGRRIMLASCWASSAAGLWLIIAEGFWMLMGAQLLFVISRAAFWPATWSMASELPGVRGIQLGRLNAVTNAGQIAGAALCGFFIVGAGYTATFVIMAVVGVVAFVSGLGTPAGPRKPARASVNMLAAYRALLGRRIIGYSMLCAYLSALPFSLSQSFYPLLLAQFGYTEETTGIVVALRAVGAIAAGLVVAGFVKTGPKTLWPVAWGAIVAAAVGLVPTVEHLAAISFWILLVGLASGAMTLYFQITMSEASRAEERGAVLALGGLGWSLSHFSTPLIMGVLADRYGIVGGFYALGALAMLVALAIGMLRRWAFASA